MGSLEFYAASAAVIPLLVLAIVYESGVTQRLAYLLAGMAPTDLLGREIAAGNVDANRAIESGLISKWDLETLNGRGGGNILERRLEPLFLSPQRFLAAFVYGPFLLMGVAFITSLIALFLGSPFPLLAILVWPGLIAGVLILGVLVVGAITEQWDVAEQASRQLAEELGLLQPLDTRRPDPDEEWFATAKERDEAIRKAVKRLLRDRMF